MNNVIRGIVDNARRVKAKEINHIKLVLDTSGSMSSIAAAARKVFNDQLDNIVRESNKNPNQTTLVSIYTFDTHLRKMMVNVKPNQVKYFTQTTYDPIGSSTALQDALGGVLSEPMEKNTSYVLLLITDGAENSSRKFNAKQITQLVNKLNATDRWSIVCLVPPGNKQSMIHCGVLDGNVTEWETTNHGIENAGQQISAGLTHYYAARSAGATSVSNFFTTNMTNVTKKDLKQCKNVSGEYFMWEVEKDSRIDEFVRSQLSRFKGITEYEAGRALYQLTKTETIQTYKEIVILDKSSGMMYSGNEARDLLGLPAYEVKVKPGDHAHFDIFVMSTSFNRKLLAGTRMLYKRHTC